MIKLHICYICVEGTWQFLKFLGQRSNNLMGSPVTKGHFILSNTSQVVPQIKYMAGYLCPFAEIYIPTQEDIFQCVNRHGEL